MLIETLDARCMMYSIGLDPTFGDNGHLSFASGFQAGHSLAAYFETQSFESGDDGSTFVSGVVSRVGKQQPSVVKLKDDGAVDTSFGVNGYASVPYEVTRMAYDDVNGTLYVGARGVGAHYDDDILKITRLRASGKIDRGFAVNGTFSYAPPMPAGPDGDDYTRASAEVTHINPLSNGAVILAVDRLTKASYETVAEQSLALFKLRPDGTRDPKYGKRGTIQLLGGTFGPVVSEGPSQDYTIATRTGAFSDVRTDRRGVTNVLIRYGAGTAANNYEFNGNYPGQFADHGQFEIKARTVTARGIEDQNAAYSWKLFEGGLTDGDPGFGIPYAGPDGDAVRAVAGGFVYTLHRGERPTRQVLETPKGLDFIVSISRSESGHYVVADLDHIVRLRGNFTLDKTFARLGLATADARARTFGNAYVDNPYIDDTGRVLAFEGLGILDRFD